MSGGGNFWITSLLLIFFLFYLYGMIALSIKVVGRVQKVGFRRFVLSKALEFNLVGWVKNLSDGSVMIHAEGTQMQLDLFLEWCYKGPVMAKVDKIEIEEKKLEKYLNFAIH